MSVTTSPVPRVALVDDHRLMAQSLGLALQEAGYEAVLIHPEADVAAQVRAWRPDVLLLDLDLGQLSGLDLLPELRTVCPVVVVTAETDTACWGACIIAGAAGVVSKSGPIDAVVTAVVAVLDGRPAVAEDDKLRWLRAHEHQTREQERNLAPFRRLTQREEQVLAAVLDGQPAAEIARTAVVSEATVRTQIRAVLTKLGVGSQLQAAALAHRVGWAARRSGRRAV